MKKWEYLFLDCAWDISCGYTPIYLNRQKLKFSTTVCAHAYCNQLGEHGWELINIPEAGEMMRMVFKRPKEG